MSVYAINHPLVQHKLGLMREADLSTKSFRELAGEVAKLLTYEATKGLELEDHEIQGWNGEPIATRRLKGKKVTIVPILRAGLGMLEGVTDLIPSARVSVVGLYRDEETLQPVPYFAKFANDIEERMAIVIDPMLATGGSAVMAIETLQAMGVKDIVFACLVAAPEGVVAVHGKFPEVPIVTAALDRELNEMSYILPGLGDAGDRIYGTVRS